MVIKPYDGLSMSENQLKVFRLLGENYDSWGESGVYYFRGMAKELGLEERLCRLATRALVRKGLVEHVRTVDEDGMVAGSGHTCSKKGAEVFERMEEYERVIEEAKTL